MYRSINYISSTLSRLLALQLEQASPETSRPRATHACGPTYPYDPTIRTIFTDTEAHIYAWPSKGGVIILNSADAIDFDFLALNPLNPPEKRLEDQSAEDDFCQRLLLLGAKWWDSEARYDIVSAIESQAQGVNSSGGNLPFNLDDEPPPSMREKRLVKVAWPSTTGGGVWIADFDTTWGGVDEEDRLLPPDGAELGHLKMARTMDERSEILRERFHANFFHDVAAFQGYAFFNCWATKKKNEGVVGPLLLPSQTRELWRDAYYGRFRKIDDRNVEPV